MTDLDLTRAKVLLRQGKKLAEVAEALGVTVRWLTECFTRETGMPPARWRREQIGSLAQDHPRVFFRVPPDEHAELASLAEAEDLSPGEWAREATRREIKRARKLRGGA